MFAYLFPLAGAPLEKFQSLGETLKHLNLPAVNDEVFKQLFL